MNRINALYLAAIVLTASACVAYPPPSRPVAYMPPPAPTPYAYPAGAYSAPYYDPAYGPAYAPAYIAPAVDLQIGGWGRGGGWRR